MPDLEYKNIPVEIKDVDRKKGIVSGYLSSFDVIDLGEDFISPGAFKKSISERGPNGTKAIKHLKNHGVNFGIGVFDTLKEDDFGLFFESKLLKTTVGNDALIEYEAGFITEHSVGYETLKREILQVENLPANVTFATGKREVRGMWGENSVRNIQEVKLYEGSAVTWGMNPDTPVLGVKGELAIDQVEEKLGLLRKYLTVGEFSDEKLQNCEILIKQLEALYKGLKSEESEEPAPSTPIGLAEQFRTSISSKFN